MVKVIVYLKSGNQITVECKEVSFTKDNSPDAKSLYIGYEFKGLTFPIMLGIDPSEIEAWTQIK